MRRRVDLIQSELDAANAQALLMLRAVSFTDPNIVWISGLREARDPTIYLLENGSFAQFGGRPPMFEESTEAPTMSVDESLYLKFWKKDLREKFSGVNKLAIVGVGAMKAGIRELLQDVSPTIELVDFTDVLAKHRAKSKEEISAISEAVYVQDKVFESIAGIVYPGCTARDIIADVNHIMRVHGTDFAGAAFPQNPVVRAEIYKDTNLPARVSHEDGTDCELYPGHRLTANDWLRFEILGHGAGGYNAGKSRNVFLCQPDDKAYEYWDLTVKSQDFAAFILRSGAVLTEVQSELNQWLKEMGCESIGDGFIEGHGAAWFEQPRMHRSNLAEIKENMVFSLGITAQKNGCFDLCRDTFVVGPSGSACLSRYPRKLITLL